MDNNLALDLLRGAHLLFIAVGMGAAMYFDLRSLHRISAPTLQADLDELNRIHLVVTMACAGLWASGIALIWVRTGFDLATFSPKLWSKLIVVTTLMLNALVLARFVIPALNRHLGVRLIDLPLRLLVPMTLCAGLSLSCWLLALALGSSSVLKLSGWDVLVPVLLGGTAFCIGGVLVVLLVARRVLRHKDPIAQTI